MLCFTLVAFARSRHHSEHGVASILGVQGKISIEERTSLREACSSPGSLFKSSQRGITAKHGLPDAEQPDDSQTKSAALQSEVNGSIVSRRGLRMADTDKLACAVVGRVLPYVCSTCMRCNKHAGDRVAWCVPHFTSDLF